MLSTSCSAEGCTAAKGCSYSLWACIAAHLSACAASMFAPKDAQLLVSMGMLSLLLDIFYFFKSWIPTVQISRCGCCCWSHTSSSTSNPALAGQSAVGGRSISTAWKMASVGLCHSATVLQVAFPYVRNPVGFLLITQKKKNNKPL